MAVQGELHRGFPLGVQDGLAAFNENSFVIGDIAEGKGVKILNKIAGGGLGNAPAHLAVLDRAAGIIGAGDGNPDELGLAFPVYKSFVFPGKTRKGDIRKMARGLKFLHLEGGAGLGLRGFAVFF